MATVVEEIVSKYVLDSSGYKKGAQDVQNFLNPRNTRQKKCPNPDFGCPDPDTFRVHHFKKFRSQSEARECVPR